MNKIDKIVQFFQERVERFGAPYYTFAIFGLINYPTAYIFEYYSEGLADSFWVRGLATILCFLLLLKDFWPKLFRRFLPVYWYLTVTVCLPVVCTFLLLKNGASLPWLMNYAVSILIVALVLDWFMSICSLFFGAVLGLVLFKIIYPGEVLWQADPQYTSIALYMYLITYLMVAVFARNKEMYNAKLLAIKEELNQRLEEQVISRTNEVEETLKHKNYFLNNVNHEIRTFVQIITNVSSGLIKGWDGLEGERRRGLAAQIDKSSSKLLLLINDVLDLSKFDSGKMRFTMTANNLDDIVQETVEELQILADEKKIKIESYKTQNLETITVFDQDRIAQVVRNLITNAIKYSGAGTVITVGLSEKDVTLPGGVINGLCVSVKDQGVGIPEQELQSIFQPFEQSSKSNFSKVGTGLGLSISLEIVTAHRGMLWAENNKDEKGSIFYCILPYEKIPVYVEEENKKDEETVGTNKLQILFVDDEEGCRMVGRMILESIGHLVKEFSSGIELLDYLKHTEERIDLILLDMMMPGMDGIDVVKQLRLQQKYRDLPVILQTGMEFQLDPSLEKHRPLGYVSKPYTKDALRKEIEKYTQVEVL